MSDQFAAPARPGAPCSPVTAVRGSLAWFRADPFLAGSRQALAYVEDGLLVCQDGKITAAGDYARLSDALPAGATVVQYRDKLIMPGFVDPHVHYVQT
jgi:guanine deaminase